VVPVFALTRGRTRSAGEETPIGAMVSANDKADRHDSTLHVEHREILALLTTPVSVVEIGAALQMPVAVAHILVSDLANAGYLTIHPPPARTPAVSPAPNS
jgi:hypothetical protein